MTNPLSTRLAAIRSRLERATPGPWASAYHNRTETWAITQVREGCDAVNDIENLIACVPSNMSAPGSSEYADTFDLIAHAPADIALLLSALDVAMGALEKYALLPDGHYGSFSARAREALTQIEALCETK